MSDHEEPNLGAPGKPREVWLEQPDGTRSAYPLPQTKWDNCEGLMRELEDRLPTGEDLARWELTRSEYEEFLEKQPVARRAARGPSSASVEERFERQARNEALLRTVNEQVAALGQGAGGWAVPGHRFEFQCECGRIEGCSGRVLMTLAEYERVRAQRDRFAVVPGHQTDGIEYVAEQNDRYVIVDKRDAFEHLVE